MTTPQQEEKNLDKAIDPPPAATTTTTKVNPFVVVLFVLFFLGMIGFYIWRQTTLVKAVAKGNNGAAALLGTEAVASAFSNIFSRNK
jgi:hypothetical protein